PQISVQLPADTTIQLGLSLPLNIVLSGLTPAQWIWTDTSYLSCLTCPNPVVQTPLETTRYTLTVLDENGCSASDDMLLMVEQLIGVFIPNAMGGSGDNANLVLGFNPAVRQINLFRVFDRWGELLHETRNALPGDAALTWDGRYRGKLVNPGVYLWQIEIELVDGSVMKKIGDLTVIR
ncbi:MAG: gliding motility-associated C-terminal domain-containing protein, partial [Saprospiraceae bacterium]|nr:gliding motility-associated C-terminal domain-containing protein [Saprospiraceae bacterium]